MHHIFLILFPGRKPGLTGRGLYELKPECTKNFNLYFYHFSRAEQSKVTNNLNLLYLFPFIFFFSPELYCVRTYYQMVFFFKDNLLESIVKIWDAAVISVPSDLMPYTELLKSVSGALGVGLRVLLHGI